MSSTRTVPGREDRHPNTRPTVYQIERKTPDGTRPGTSTSSSLAPASEAASPRSAWWRRATASRSWRWAAAGRPRTCRRPVGHSIAGSGGRAWRCAASSTCASSGTSPSCTAAPSAAARSPTPAPCCGLRTKFGTAARGRAWTTGSRRCRSTTTPRRTCWASPRTRFWGRRTGCCKTAAESVGVGDTFYRTSVAIFQAPEGVAGRSDLSRPVLRRRGPGAHHLQRLAAAA